MRVAHLLALAIGVSSAILEPLANRHANLPDITSKPMRANDRHIKPFSISNLYARSVGAGTPWNRRLSFTFSDPNSNTSTICAHAWIDSHNSTTAPTAYVPCNKTGDTEYFQWMFTSYSSLHHFSIEFSHGWDDPADYPPPYSFVGMFSSGNDFNTTCETNSDGEQWCGIERSPYYAVVNGLTN